jgi:hypothetical protein
MLRYAMRSVLFALSFAVAAPTARAADWNWTLIQPGSEIVVLRGIAEVERSGGRVTAVLRERGETRYFSRLSARIRDGKLSNGSVVVSHTDGGPIGLSQGRWLVHRTSPPGSTIETIWLLEPRTGHYLVITRSTNR